jgi:hypothetical protein
MYLECDGCNELLLRQALLRVRSAGIDLTRLDFDPLKLRPHTKFDIFLPEELLRKEVIAECLDAEGAMDWVNQEFRC